MTKFDEDLDVSDSFTASLDEDDIARLKVMERVTSKYMRSERDDELASAVKTLVERMIASGDPKVPTSVCFRKEGRAVVVVGWSGAGKTTALERLFSQHLAFPGYAEQGSGCPLVTVSVDGPCVLSQLGRQILAELGYPLVADKKEHVIWQMVRAKLQALGVRILHLDEIQNVTTGADAAAAVRIRNTFKSLMNDKRYPIGLILSGLPEVLPFLDEDNQVRRRSRSRVFFRPLTSEDVVRIRNTVVKLAGVADLGVSERDAIEIAPRLIRASTGEMGIAVEMVHHAIDDALKRKKKSLTIESFASVYAGMTGAAAPKNPFVAENWHEIACLGEEEDEPAEKAPVQPRKRRPAKQPKWKKRGF